MAYVKPYSFLRAMMTARNLKTQYSYNFTASVLPLTGYFIIREEENVIS